MAPATLGGAPLSPTGTDASWVGRALPDYDPSDVLFEYYDGRETGHGLISLLAIRGPVDDLPDRTSAAGDPSEWSVTDRVQCGPLYLSSPQTTSQAAVKTDGHVCWRTSGAFSISVLTTDHDLDETISLVNQAWASQ